jgi:hypothetical protein
MDGCKGNRSRLAAAPASEGANIHCIMENRRLAGLVVFDWPDDVK